MPENDGLEQNELLNDEEIDFNIPQDLVNDAFMNNNAERDFEEDLELDDLSELEGNFDGYDAEEVAMAKTEEEKKEEGFHEMEPEDARFDTLNHTIIENYDAGAIASDPEVRLHFFEDEVIAEEKATEEEDLINEQKKASSNEEVNESILPELEFSEEEKPAADDGDYEEEESESIHFSDLFKREDSNKIHEFAQGLQKEMDDGFVNAGVQSNASPSHVKGKRPDIVELTQDHRNVGGMRSAFNALDAERTSKKLNGFFSWKTEEYTAMVNSFEDLRRLQSTRGVSAKELADKMDELQENARKYYEKKSTEKQNTRRANRLAWAKKIMDMENKYTLPAAYEAIDKQKQLSAKLINESFDEENIHIGKLAIGVARYILTDMVEKQVAKEGKDLSYNDVKLMTNPKRLESSLKTFVADKMYQDFMYNQSADELRDMYTLSGNALVNGDKTSAELLSERLHKKLLNRINKLEKKAENKKTASREKTVQKESKVNSLA